LTPQVHNSKSLGTAALSWSKVYSVGGVDQTSDGRKKKARGLSDAEIAVGLELATSFMSYLWTDGTDDKTHFGIIAQQVMQTFEDNGLNPMDYGVVRYEQGILEKINPGSYEVISTENYDVYAVNYAEIQSLCI
ncbi:tail fiber domain-containing protein, partial [Yersinia sp. 2544 StPb PI]|uniref:tail fiber domain-containing protein n=1 Tax=Yersinia sp. 2544 StPb PI TaxID=3117409 RepID=UPI003B27F420